MPPRPTAQGNRRPRKRAPQRPTTRSLKAGARSSPPWSRGSAALKRVRPTFSGTRSTTSRPQPAIIATLAGLLVISRTREKPIVRRIVGADAEVALVVLEPQPVVRLDRVEPLVLQRVGPHLVGEPDAAPLLVQVEQHPRPLRRDLPERRAGAAAPQSHFRLPSRSPVKQAECSRQSSGAPPVRRADLDGVVLLGAVERPEHPHPARLADRQRHPRRRDLDHRPAPPPPTGTSPTSTTVSPSSAIACRSRSAAIGTTSAAGSRCAGLQSAIAARCSAGAAAAPGRERPLHRPGEVGRGVGGRPHPAEVGVRGQRDPREVAVVGPRLQRLGPPAGDREVDRPERPQVGEPLGRRRLRGERRAPRRRRRAARRRTPMRRSDARPRQRLERRKAEAHPFPPGEPAALKQSPPAGHTAVSRPPEILRTPVETNSSRHKQESKHGRGEEDPDGGRRCRPARGAGRPAGADRGVRRLRGRRRRGRPRPRQASSTTTS